MRDSGKPLKYRGGKRPRHGVQPLKDGAETCPYRLRSVRQYKEYFTDNVEEKQIDNKFAAYKLLEILFKEGLINFSTYTKIEAERKAYAESKHKVSDT